jgi:hypothetical protein
VAGGQSGVLAGRQFLRVEPVLDGAAGELRGADHVAGAASLDAMKPRSSRGWSAHILAQVDRTKRGNISYTEFITISYIFGQQSLTSHRRLAL